MVGGKPVIEKHGIDFEGCDVRLKPSKSGNKMAQVTSAAGLIQLGTVNNHVYLKIL